MAKTQKTNLVDRLMGEYVMWGGPIVTRAEAFADCTARGIVGQERDAHVFMRAAVAAPADPEAHVAFLRQIQALEMAVAA